MKLKLMTAAAVIAMFAMGSLQGASANIVSVYDADDPFLIDATADAGGGVVIQGFSKIFINPHVKWNPDGTGVDNNVILSNSEADEVEQLGGSEADETGFLNLLLAEVGEAAVSVLDTLKICDGNCGSSFLINTLYFSLKLGNDTAFFKNLTGGTVTINLETFKASGLSHVTTYGGNNTPAVPLPAALPLLLTGIGGISLLGWRRGKKSAL